MEGSKKTIHLLDYVPPIRTCLSFSSIIFIVELRSITFMHGGPPHDNTTGLGELQSDSGEHAQ